MASLSRSLVRRTLNIAKGNSNVPVGDAVINKLEIALPQVARHLKGRQLGRLRQRIAHEEALTLPQEKQRTGMIILAAAPRHEMGDGISVDCDVFGEGSVCIRCFPVLEGFLSMPFTNQRTGRQAMGFVKDQGRRLRKVPTAGDSPCYLIIDLQSSRLDQLDHVYT